jgi:hypothetical protein
MISRLGDTLSSDSDRSLFQNNHYVVAIQVGLVAFHNGQNDSFFSVLHPKAVACLICVWSWSPILTGADE